MLLPRGCGATSVRLINVITAALLAVNFFEPLARTLDGWQPSYTYLWDFLSLWGLFGVFLLVFREITDRVSHVNVRFLKLADRIGSVVLSLWIGYVMVCFTMMTLHTAPLGRNFLFEGFSTQTDARMFFGIAARPGMAGIHAEDVDRRVCRFERIRPECRVHAEVRHPPHRTRKTHRRQ